MDQLISLHGKRFEPSLINPKSPGDLIKRWIRAHIRAILYIRKNPEDAAQLAAKELKLAPEVTLGATKLLMPVISADAPAASRKTACVSISNTAPAASAATRAKFRSLKSRT